MGAGRCTLIRTTGLTKERTRGNHQCLDAMPFLWQIFEAIPFKDVLHAGEVLTLFPPAGCVSQD